MTSKPDSPSDTPEHADVYLKSQTTTNAVTNTVRSRLEQFKTKHSNPGFAPLTTPSKPPLEVTCTPEDLDIARRIEKSLGIFVNQSKDVFLRADEHSFIEYISPTCKGLLGYSASSLIGTPFLSFVHPEDLQKTTDLMRLHMPKRHVYNFENRVITAHKEIIIVGWSATAWSLERVTYARIQPRTNSVIPDPH